MKVVRNSWPILLAFAIIGLFIVYAQFQDNPSNRCSRYTSAKLSAGIVEQVNRERSDHGMPNNDDKVILARQVTNGAEAQARARFDTRACGFTVKNLFTYHVSGDMTEEKLLSDYSDNISRDVIRVVDVNGFLLGDTDPEQCVSDTVPLATIVDGGINVTLVCNRPYPAQESAE